MYDEMYMNATIHPLQGEAMLEALYLLNQYSLHPSPPYQNRDEWMAIVRERKGVTCHAAFEGMAFFDSGDRAAADRNTWWMAFAK